MPLHLTDEELTAMIIKATTTIKAARKLVLDSKPAVTEEPLEVSGWDGRRAA